MIKKVSIALLSIFINDVQSLKLDKSQDISVNGFTFRVKFGDDDLET